MADILLQKPAAGQTITLAPQAEDRLVFDFNSGDATLTRDGDTLVMSFDDGSSLSLTNFYEAYTAENMPTFVIEGAEVGGQEFFAALGEELMPAAGPTASTAQGSGSSVDTIAGTLLGGVDRLGRLDQEGEGTSLLSAAAEAADGAQPIPNNAPIVTDVIALPDGNDDGNTAAQAVGADVGVKESGVGFGSSDPNAAYDGDTSARGQILATDLDGDTLSFSFPNGATGTVQGQYGEFTLNADGTFSYKLTSDNADNTTEDGVDSLNAGENVQETFTVQVSDGNGGVTTTTVTVNIQGTNDKPEIGFTGDTSLQETSDVITTGSIIVTDYDDDGDTFAEQTVTVDGQTVDKTADTVIEGTYGTLTIKPSGEYSYELYKPGDAKYENVANLDEGRVATENFDVVTEDAHGAKDSSNLEFTIAGTDNGVTVKPKPVDPTDPSNPEVPTNPETGNPAFSLDEADLAGGTNNSSENPSLEGSLSIDAKDGLSEIIINGTTVATYDESTDTWIVKTPLATQYGEVNITVSGDHSGYTVDYTYELTSPADVSGDATHDDLTFGFKDTDGTVADQKVEIEIVDDAPVAKAENVTANTVTSGETSAVQDASAYFNKGADQNDTTLESGETFVAEFSVLESEENPFTQAPAESGTETTYTFAWGSVTLDTVTGEYTVTPNNEADSVKFDIQYQDGDGDKDSTTVNFEVDNKATEITFPDNDGDGTADKGDVLITSDDAIAGNTEDNDQALDSGSFSFTSKDGVQSITINNETVTFENGQATVEGTYGDLVLTLKDDGANGYTVEYTYTQDTVKDHAAGNAEAGETGDSFTINGVTNGNGTYSDYTDGGKQTAPSIDVTINDDVPVVAAKGSVSLDVSTADSVDVFTFNVGADAPQDMADLNYAFTVDAPFTYDATTGEVSYEGDVIGSLVVDTASGVVSFNYDSEFDPEGVVPNLSLSMTVTDTDGDVVTSANKTTIDLTGKTTVVVDPTDPADTTDPKDDNSTPSDEQSAAGVDHVLQDSDTIGTAFDSAYGKLVIDSLDAVTKVEIQGKEFTFDANGNITSSDTTVTQNGVTITVGNFNPDTGELEYSMKLEEGFEHKGELEDGELSFTVSVNGAETTIDVVIEDDVPTEKDTTISLDDTTTPLVEFTTTGNASSFFDRGGDGTDSAGKELGSYTLVDENGNPVDGNFAWGTVTLNPNTGEYTITGTDGKADTGSFSVQYTDKDGDSAISDITVNINNSINVKPGDPSTTTETLIVGEANLSGGTAPDANALAQQGDGNLTVTAPDGLTSVSLGGTELATYDAATGTWSYSGTANTDNGTVSIKNVSKNEDGTYNVEYQYTLTTPDSHPEKEPDYTYEDSFTLSFKDTDGSVGSETVYVDIIDDKPTIKDPDTTTTTIEATNMGEINSNTVEPVKFDLDNVVNFGADGESTTADITLTVPADSGYTLNNGVLSYNGTVLGSVTVDQATNEVTITKDAGANEAFKGQELPTLNLGYTVTDGDGDTASGNLSASFDFAYGDNNNGDSADVKVTITTDGSDNVINKNELDTDGGVKAEITLDDLQEGDSTLTVTDQDGNEKEYTVNKDPETGDVTVKDENGKDVPVTTNPDGKPSITVTMPKPENDGDVSIDATITDPDGNTATGGDDTTLDTGASATITVDTVTSDNILNDAELEAGKVTITGTVGGDAAAGDKVTITVNNQDYETTVKDDKTYEVNVDASDLKDDADNNIDAKVEGTDDNGNAFTGKGEKEYSIDATGAIIGGQTNPEGFNESNLVGGTAENADALTKGGSFTVTTPQDDLESLTIDGNVIKLDGTDTSFTTKDGMFDVVVTDVVYKDGKYEVSYEATLNEEYSHKEGETLLDDKTLTFEVTTTDKAGNEETGELSFTINDDTPAGEGNLTDDITNAEVATGSVSFESADGITSLTLNGNEVTLENGVPKEGTTITLTEGTVTFGKDGAYTFTPDSDYVGSVTLTFEATDADGDTKPHTETVTVVESDVTAPTVTGASDIILDEAHLAAGTDAQVNGAKYSQSFTIDADGDLASITIAGQPVDLNGFAGSIDMGQYTISGVTITAATDGSGNYTVNYDITLKDNIEHSAPDGKEGGSDEVKDASTPSFSVTATDTNGNESGKTTINVDIKDDVVTLDVVVNAADSYNDPALFGQTVIRDTLTQEGFNGPLVEGTKEYTVDVYQANSKEGNAEFGVTTGQVSFDAADGATVSMNIVSDTVGTTKQITIDGHHYTLSKQFTDDNGDPYYIVGDVSGEWAMGFKESDFKEGDILFTITFDAATNSWSMKQYKEFEDTVILEFTATDGDGDTTTLNVGVTGATEGFGPNVLSATTVNVDEAGLTSDIDESETGKGIIEVTAADGLKEIKIGGDSLGSFDADGNFVANADYKGNVSITSVTGNAENGYTVKYEYTLQEATNENVNEGDISFEMTFVDNNNDASNATVKVDVQDDVPVINAQEDAAGDKVINIGGVDASGNPQGLIHFEMGADSGAGASITLGSVTAEWDGTSWNVGDNAYTPNADGSVTIDFGNDTSLTTTNNEDWLLKAPEGTKELGLTIKDADGDVDSSKVTVNADAPTNVVEGVVGAGTSLVAGQSYNISMIIDNQSNNSERFGDDLRHEVQDAIEQFMSSTLVDHVSEGEGAVINLQFMTVSKRGWDNDAPENAVVTNFRFEYDEATSSTVVYEVASDGSLNKLASFDKDDDTSSLGQTIVDNLNGDVKGGNLQTSGDLGGNLQSGYNAATEWLNKQNGIVEKDADGNVVDFENKVFIFSGNSQSEGYKAYRCDVSEDGTYAMLSDAKLTVREHGYTEEAFLELPYGYVYRDLKIEIPADKEPGDVWTTTGTLVYYSNPDSTGYKGEQAVTTEYVVKLSVDENGNPYLSLAKADRPMADFMEAVGDGSVTSATFVPEGSHSSVTDRAEHDMNEWFNGLTSDWKATSDPASIFAPKGPEMVGVEYTANFVEGSAAENFMFGGMTLEQIVEAVQEKVGIEGYVPSTMEAMEYILNNPLWFESVTIATDSADSDIIMAGKGDDVVFGQGGDDLLMGGGSLDNLEQFAKDLGMNEADAAKYGNIDASLTAEEVAVLTENITSMAKDPANLDKLVEAANQLDATTDDDNDMLFGGAGNDVLLGLGGDDILHGGDGSDILLGGSGDDVLFAGKGDIALGGSGNDIIKLDGIALDEVLSVDGGEGLDVLLTGVNDLDTVKEMLAKGDDKLSNMEVIMLGDDVEAAQKLQEEMAKNDDNPPSGWNAVGTEQAIGGSSYQEYSNGDITILMRLDTNA